MTLLTILGVTEILCIVRLVLEGKTGGKDIHDLSRLELLKKFSGNNFALPDAGHNTSKLLNGGIASLPLSRKLLTIRQKSPQPKFWEVMESFCFTSIC